MPHVTIMLTTKPTGGAPGGLKRLALFVLFTSVAARHSVIYLLLYLLVVFS